jgi:superfamily I DNA/RNA helicase
MDPEAGESLYESVRSSVPLAVTSNPELAVHGPPGTGKTYTLQQVVEDEMGRGTDPKDVCATSFRTDMARALAEAVAERTGGSSPWLGTTHAVCLRLLGEARDVDVVTDKHRADFCRTFGRGVPFSKSYEGELDPDSPFSKRRTPQVSEDDALGDKLFDLLQVIKTTGAAFEVWATVAPPGVLDAGRPGSRVDYPSALDLRTFNRAWCAYKRARGLVDFEDMFLMVVDENLSPPCDVLIEDEFQDKTPLMVAVHNQWARRAKRVYVAGDPDQSIYSYMGTDPKFMQGALDRASETRVLSHSYRNPDRVTTEARRVLTVGGHDPPVVEGEEDDGGVFLLSSLDEYAEAVAEHEADSTFHLFRVNKSMSMAADVLEDAGIPFASKSGKRWTDKQVAFYNAFARLAGVFDSHSFGSTPTFESLGSTDKDMIAESVDGSLWRVPKGDFPGFDSFDGELTDVIELRGLSEIATASNPMAMLNGDGPLNKSVFAESINERLERTWASRGAEVMDDPDHYVTTIHGSKGLEADVVFLFTATTRAAVSDGPYPEGEEARVWYVGATRTQGDLYVVDVGGIKQSLPIDNYDNR